MELWLTRFEYTCFFVCRLLKVGYARFFLCLFTGVADWLAGFSAEKDGVKKAMVSDPIVERVSGFAEDLLPTMGLELVEVQFRREQHGWVLRLFVDAEGGITLDHCSQVSREVGDYLDVEDVIDHAYHLEISSPGLERKLRNIQDFVRFSGKMAKIKVHKPLDGQKVFIGTISEVVEDTIVLEMEGGVKIDFTLDMISMARLAI